MAPCRSHHGGRAAFRSQMANDGIKSEGWALSLRGNSRCGWPNRRIQLPMGMGQWLFGGEFSLRLRVDFDLQLGVFQESRHQGTVVPHVHRFAYGLKMVSLLQILLQQR